ncbi:hypothetical protein BN440_1243 [Erwinia amylovora MR1]|nr:hypothetical protein BN440_1243 [Erwinia amylovora MR1]
MKPLFTSRIGFADISEILFTRLRQNGNFITIIL